MRSTDAPTRESSSLRARETHDQPSSLTRSRLLAPLAGSGAWRGGLRSLWTICTLCAMLALTLSACGAASANGGPTPTSGPAPTSESSTPTSAPPAPSIPDALTTPPTDQSGVAQGLRLQATIGCNGFTVLAKDSSAYSSGDIQAMRDALSSASATSASVPDMRFVYSGVTSDTSDFYGCTGHLEITNAGSSTVNIVGGGVRLTASPTSNDFHYQLLTICNGQYGVYPQSLMCGRGSGPNCAYQLTIPLSQGDAGSDFNTTFVASGCPQTITLNPGDSAAEVDITFAPNAAMIWQANPELLLTDSSGQQQVVVFSDIQATIAYADTQQFSCYGVVNGGIGVVPASVYTFNGQELPYECD